MKACTAGDNPGVFMVARQDPTILVYWQTSRILDTHGGSDAETTYAQATSVDAVKPKMRTTEAWMLSSSGTNSSDQWPCLVFFAHVSREENLACMEY